MTAVQQVQMPRGGGGIQGLEDHFQASEHSGELSYLIPIACPPCRGSEPSLTLSYSSFAGNGLFGIGFAVGLSSIARRTSQRIPRYDDSDVFVLDGAQLTPIPGGRSRRTVGGVDYALTAFRPRQESACDRIERWSAGEEAFWRVIDRDAVVWVYGRSAAARVADPADPTRVAEWLLEYAIHPRGDLHSYLYCQEDSAGVAPRLSEQGRSRTANRYIERIRYGNERPYTSPDGGITPPPEQLWHFEIVFDYGQYDARAGNDSPYEPVGEWSARADPWSSYGHGFERRTHRLCRNVLTFHRFPDELGPEPALVRALELGYDERPTGALLTSARLAGYQPFPAQPPGQRYAVRRAPAIELTYTPFAPSANTAPRLLLDTAGLPVEGFAVATGRELVDLFGDGVPGMLLYAGGGPLEYRAPALRGGDGSGSRSWTPRAPLTGFPVERTAAGAGIRLADLNGDGALDLVHDLDGVSGCYRSDGAGGWRPFAPFAGRLSDPGDPRYAAADLDGDGRAELLWREGDSLGYVPCLGEDGYGPAQIVPAEPTLPPLLEGEDPSQLVTFAELLGGGTPCLVRIADGSVECWPSLGYGRFGARVRIDGAPRCAQQFDPRRVYLADLDGSGAPAIVFAYADRVEVYANQSGNSFAAEPLTVALPAGWSDPAQIRFEDLDGNGYRCLLFSTDDPEPRTWAIDLCAARKPYLLQTVANGSGARTTFSYRSSAWYALRDRRDGRPWATRLPFPLPLLARSLTEDRVSGSTNAVSYRYRHGHYDPLEREYRGFGMVERIEGDAVLGGDVVAEADAAAAGEPHGDPLHVPAALVRTWFHTGAWESEAVLAAAYGAEYWDGDPSACPPPTTGVDFAGAAGDPESARQACVALSGCMLREERYGLDGSACAGVPYEVSEQSWTARMLQPASPAGYASFLVHERQLADSNYERVADDPLVHQHFVLAVDEWGDATREITVACRRRTPGDAAGQGQPRAIVSERSWNGIVAQPDTLLLGRPAEVRISEMTGFAEPDVLGLYYSAELIAAEVENALQARDVARLEDVARVEDARRIKDALGRSGPSLAPLRQHRFVYAGDSSSGAPITPQALLLACEEAFAADGGLQATFAGAPLGGRPLRELLEQQGGFRLDPDGLWWSPGERDAYAGPEGFYRPRSTSDPFAAAGGPRPGGVVEYCDDPHRLLLASVTTRSAAGDVLPHTVAATRIDYVALAPCQVTGANGTVHEAVREPLGTVALLSSYGSEWSGTAAQRVGYAPLDFSTPVPLPATLAELLANPAAYVGGAASYAFEDLDAFCDGRGPAASATLTATLYPSDGASTPAGPIQMAVSLHDGERRLVQSAELAEPDPASFAASAPPRWRVRKRLVLNDRGLVAACYLPFFAAAPAYVDEATLAAQGTLCTTTFYDAVERAVRVETPKGTMAGACFAVHAYGAWETSVEDANDTIEDSDWWAAVMRGGAAVDWEQDALRKAAGAYRTPEVHATDALGFTSEVRRLLSADDAPLIERRAHDALGGELWAADPRLGAVGIHNIERVYALTGAVLRVQSVDAGTRWYLHDCLGKQIYAGDSRGFAIATDYDGLHRPTSTRVVGGDGTPALDCTVARRIYGDSLDATGAPPVAQPADRNLMGAIWRHYDSAGLLERDSVALTGGPRVEIFRVRSLYDREADWRLTGEEPDWAHTTAVLDQALAVDPQGRSIDYDGLGRSVRETDAAGNATAPSYLVSGLLGGLCWTPCAGVERAYLAAVEHDAAGQPLRVTHNGPGGQPVLATDYTYDPGTARVTSILVRRLPDETPVQAARWYWDPVGNPTHIAFDTAPGPQGVPADCDFTYDALYRLTAAGGRAQAGYTPALERAPGYGAFFAGTGEPGAERYTSAYGYDAANNLRSTAYAGSTRFSRELLAAPGSNRAVLSPGTAGPDPTAGRFDANGNQIALDGIDELAWNSANRLQRVRADGATEHLLYDARGRRRARVVEAGDAPAILERTLYLDGGLERCRRTSDGEVAAEVDRVRIAAHADTVAVRLDWRIGSSPPPGAATAWFQIGDLVDSAVLELDDDGRLAHHESYLPFGATALAGSPAGAGAIELKTHRFGGHERDGTSGLYSLGVRCYAPWLGRWTSPDPGLDIDGLNLYAYAACNPTTYVDHSGLGRSKKNKLAVRIEPYKQKNKHDAKLFRIKIEGRPRFESWVQQALPSVPGLNRNHIFPWFAQAKEIRTLTRRKPLEEIADYLRQHHFANKFFQVPFDTLAAGGLQSIPDVVAGIEYVVLDRFNDLANLYMGLASANKSMGSKMMHLHRALKAEHENPKLTPVEVAKLQWEFLTASIDLPGATAQEEAEIEARFWRVWGQTLGKYVPLSIPL
jgi:RHS repeat-associated protein